MSYLSEACLHNAQDWSDMDEGWLYGEWETGPWWAFHDKVSMLFPMPRNVYFRSKCQMVIAVVWYCCQISNSENKDFYWSRNPLPNQFLEDKDDLISEVFKEKEGGSYGWVGAGVGMRGSPLVWRHTCVIADFIKVSWDFETIFALLTHFVNLAISTLCYLPDLRY